MLKIAICDDCKEDRERVHTQVKEFLETRFISAEVRVYDHPDNLVTECENFRPHIYILDIVMPMISGIEAARELRWNQPDAEILFITSESSFALESFDVNPISYIMKPVDEDRLFETLELAIRRVNPENERSLTIKVRGGFRTIRADDVMYVDYRNHVVTYHLFSKEEISTTTLRIGFAEYAKENLIGYDFVQCHESVAVNIKAVDRLSRNEIAVRNKEIIPVSKSRYAEVADAYMSYRFR